jgi:hypothetical protein
VEAMKYIEGSSGYYATISCAVIKLEKEDIKALTGYSDGTDSKKIMKELKSCIDIRNKARSVCVRDNTALGILNALKNAIEETEKIRREFLIADGIIKNTEKETEQ